MSAPSAVTDRAYSKKSPQAGSLNERLSP